MMVLTSAVLAGSDRLSGSMKDRSIFKMSTGNRWR